MADNDAKIIIGADASGLEAGMRAAADSVRAGVAQISGAFEGIQGTFEKLNALMLGFGAVLAGGAAFKEAVGGTVEMTKEAMQLSRSLGITATQASVLNVALDDIYQSSDTVVSATQKITKTLKDNEAAFKALGVATRDASGQFRNSLDIMLDTNEALLKFREGTDRNIEGMKIYGKAWAEVQPLLKLTTELMEESRKKAEALGLVLGEENVQQVAQYRAAMNDANDVMKAVKKVIGDTLMPGLTEMGKWFSDVGPQLVEGMRAAFQGFNTVMGTVKDAASALWQALSAIFGEIYSLIMAVFAPGSAPVGAMEFFKNVLKVIEVAFISLRVGIQTSFEFIKGMILGLIEDLKMFGAIASAALRLDGSGIAAAWRSGTARAEAVVRQSMSNIVAIAVKGRADMDAAIMGNLGAPPKFTAIKQAPGGLGSSGGAKTAGSAQDISKAIAAMEQAAQEAAAAIRREALAEEMADYDNAYKHFLLSAKDFYDQKTRIEQEALQAEIDAKSAEAQQIGKTAESSKNEKDRLLLIAQRIKLLGEVNVLEAKRAQVAVANSRLEADAERQRFTALEQIRIAASESAAQAGVQAERVALEQKKALYGIDNANYLAAQRELENQSYRIAEDGIKQRLQLAEQERDPVKIAQINAQIEQMERDHQNRLNEIDKAATEEREKYNLQVYDGMKSAFTGLFESIATGTKNLRQIFQDFVNSITQMISKLAAQSLADQLFSNIKIGGVGQGGSSGIGGLLSGAGNWIASMLKSYDVGTDYVPQTGLALIHKGERIIPANQNVGMASPQIVMNISTPDANSFMASKAQIMMQMGMATRATMGRNG